MAIVPWLWLSLLTYQLWIFIKDLCYSEVSNIYSSLDGKFRLTMLMQLLGSRGIYQGFCTRYAYQVISARRMAPNQTQPHWTTLTSRTSCSRISSELSGSEWYTVACTHPLISSSIQCPIRRRFLRHRPMLVCSHQCYRQGSYHLGPLLQYKCVIGNFVGEAGHIKPRIFTHLSP